MRYYYVTMISLTMAATRDPPLASSLILTMHTVSISGIGYAPECRTNTWIMKGWMPSPTVCKTRLKVRWGQMIRFLKSSRVARLPRWSIEGIRDRRCIGNGRWLLRSYRTKLDVQAIDPADHTSYVCWTKQGQKHIIHAGTFDILGCR